MTPSLSLPGFSSPSAGPEAPLDLLAACHGRVEKQCQTLERLQRHLPIHGSDVQAQEAAQTIIRYFETAARHHHEDEEHDLFPALVVSMAGSDAVCIRELTAALVLEHRALERRWHALRLTLQDIAHGLAGLLSTTEVEDFTQAYRQHIERENRDLLPMAARLLNASAVHEIGQAMIRRRRLPQ